MTTLFWHLFESCWWRAIKYNYYYVLVKLHTYRIIVYRLVKDARQFSSSLTVHHKGCASFIVFSHKSSTASNGYIFHTFFYWFSFHDMKLMIERELFIIEQFFVCKFHYTTCLPYTALILVLYRGERMLKFIIRSNKKRICEKWCWKRNF